MSSDNANYTKPYVGNCPSSITMEEAIKLGYLFQQKCDCNQFPCDCHFQDKKGNWHKKEKSNE